MNSIWKNRIKNGLLEMTLNPSTSTDEVRKFNITMLELCCSIFETIENIAKFRVSYAKDKTAILLDYMVIRAELMNMICLLFSDRDLVNYIEPVIDTTVDNKRIISIEKFGKTPRLPGVIFSEREVYSNTRDEYNKKFVEYVYHVLITAQQMSIKGF
jgi:hypothetical protein